jgi:hypothetical protein
MSFLWKPEKGCALGHLKVAIIDEQTFISCGYYEKIDLLMAFSSALSLLSVSIQLRIRKLTLYTQANEESCFYSEIFLRTAFNLLWF